jgi:hypothetical protein
MRRKYSSEIFDKYLDATLGQSERKDFQDAILKDPKLKEELELHRQLLTLENELAQEEHTITKSVVEDVMKVIIPTQSMTTPDQPGRVVRLATWSFDFSWIQTNTARNWAVAAVCAMIFFAIPKSYLEDHYVGESRAQSGSEEVVAQAVGVVAETPSARELIERQVLEQILGAPGLVAVCAFLLCGLGVLSLKSSSGKRPIIPATIMLAAAGWLYLFRAAISIWSG